jgi:hypothetical protein
VTFQLAYPIVICRARLLTIGAHYEEAARDLGASALGASRGRPAMLYPAILVSLILVFADVLDDFVIVRYLSSDASTETTSMRIYQTARAAPTPALNAMATIILVVSTLVIVLRLARLSPLGEAAGGCRRHQVAGRQPVNIPAPSTGGIVDRLPDRARIVVVGGGVIGCSIAYHLTQLGIRDVLLVEKHSLTAGTTWHAAGLITSAGFHDETSLWMCRYSRDLYERLEEQTGHATGFQAGRPPVGRHHPGPDADAGTRTGLPGRLRGAE